MPQLRFHIYTFVGSWPWCFALAYAGMKLGNAWNTDPRLKHILHESDAAVRAAAGSRYGLVYLDALETANRANEA